MVSPASSKVALKQANGKSLGRPRKTLAQVLERYPRALEVVQESFAKGVRKRGVAMALGMSLERFNTMLTDEPELRVAMEQGDRKLHDRLLGVLCAGL